MMTECNRAGVREIRQATTDDKHVVERMNAAAEPEWSLGPGLISLAFGDPTFQVFLAEGPNGPIGYGILRLEGDSGRDGTGMVYMMYVEAQYRRQGFGGRLLRHMLKVSNSAGFQVVRLMVDLDNQPAYSLYKRLGFQERRVEMYRKP